MPQAATATTKMENIVSSSQSHNALVVSCCAVLSYDFLAKDRVQGPLLSTSGRSL